MKLSDFINKNQSSYQNSSNQAQTTDLEVILDIIKKVNSKLSLSDVLNDVLRYAIKITFSDRGFILLEDQMGNLKYEIGVDVKGHKISSEEFRISSRVASDVFATGHSRFIEGAQRDRELKKSQSIANLLLQTILCSPLTVQGKVIGVIYVDSTTLKKINISDITRTFEILAGQAAIAIRNAQLFEKMVFERERAEEFNKLKLEFLDQVSHEIRTPLNVIMSFSQLIGDELKDEINLDIKDSLRLIRSSGDRIVRTIDLILRVSELKSGSYNFRYAKLDLNEILTNVIDSYIPKIVEKKISIKRDAEAKHFIVGDKSSIKEMLENVIDNSVKFTKDGEIKVKFTDQTDYLILEINDTGVGISEDFLPSVFDHFTQEESGYSRTYDGIGLGLTLVKYLAEVNNCEVKLFSKKGKGTSIKFHFPKSNRKINPTGTVLDAI